MLSHMGIWDREELRVRVQAESPHQRHYRWLSSMTKHIDIGDPPVSSLASCLRSFPGGFSLLTETARLRAFFVGDDTPGYVAVVATSLIELSTSLGGSFPLDKDIPVDHTWSEDGILLTLLHRGGFMVYSRPDGLSMDATLAQSKEVDEIATPDESSTSASTEPTPRGERILGLGLDLRCSGTNSFEGKVVSCISCSTTCRTPAGGRSSTEDDDGRADGSDRGSYVIAVGGSFGIECHLLEIGFRHGDRSSGKSPASARPDLDRGCGVEADADRPSQRPTSSVNRTGDGEEIACVAVACRSYTTLFCGYPVVSMEYSPKANLLAAAAMTGHVKVWNASTIRDGAFLPPAPEVPSISPPELPSISPPPKSRRHSTGNVRGRGSGRGKGTNKGKGDESRKERSQRGKRRPQERRVSLEAMLAGSTRQSPPAMPRGAEAMWSFTLDAARATSLAFTSDGSGTLALGCWDGRIIIFLPCSTDTADVFADADKCVAETATATDPADGSGGMQKKTCIRAWKPVWRENPEDDKIAGPPRGGEHFEDHDGTFVSWCGGRGQSPGFGLVISSCRVAGSFRYSRPDDGCVSSILGLSHGVHGGTGLIDHLSGPGFGIFEGGLGKQIGGLLTRRGPGRRKLKAAERYSIHGMVASASFVALYDSDLCLHIVSLSEATKTGGGILAPRVRSSAASQADSTILSRIRQLQEVLAVSHEGQEACDNLTGSKSSSGTGRVVLANNDHGLVASEPEHEDLDEYSGEVNRAGGRSRLTIVWRDAATGMEAPDDGACTGGTANHGLLSFLPGYGEPSGLLTAHVRRGRVALFSTYVVVVYERPDPAKTGLRPATDANLGREDATGKWRAYPGGPNIYGLLIGGPSTMMPVSPKLAKAPADLAQDYLLVVQGSIGENGEALAVTVRSLNDRRASFRCPLPDDTTGMDKQNGMRVYVSPGYSGGVFVVALTDDEDTRTCATIWRGSFDEAKPRVELSSSKIVTTWPWPEPSNLQLAGVSGPNCELILFKEKVELASASRDPEDAETERVRWWITWPELAIWRYVDTPRTLGGEELGVEDFVKIYQQLLESMLTAHKP